MLAPGNHQSERLAEHGHRRRRAHGVARTGAAGHAPLKLFPAVVVEPSAPALVPHPPQVGAGADRRPRKFTTGRDPPVTSTAGTLALTAPISAPGTLLSQLPSSTTPSIGLALIISSTSIASRLRYSIAVGFIRSSPSEMTGNSTAIPPAASIPSLIGSTRSRKRQVAGIELAGRVGDADDRPVRRRTDRNPGTGERRPVGRARPRRPRRARHCFAAFARSPEQLQPSERGAFTASMSHRCRCLGARAAPPHLGGSGTPRPFAPGPDWISSIPLRAIHSSATTARCTFSVAIAAASATRCAPLG